MPQARPDHIPEGDPCRKCSLPAFTHRRRVEHTPDGPVCSCGLPAQNHRIRVRNRTEEKREYYKDHKNRFIEYRKKRQRNHPHVYTRIAIGLDGEGWTDASGKHHYSYIAACTKDECLGELYDSNGLSTSAIFEWLLRLKQPEGAIFVGFALGYDITKWIEDMPESCLYLLNHSEYRQGKFRSRPVRWRQFKVNRMSTQFAVADEEGRKITVWDFFKFFGKSFVKSLEDWKIGTPEIRESIQSMKDKRGSFEGIHQQEQDYCKSECMLLAQLAETLIAAHKDAGIKLAQYYGPGSTASAMLKAMGAKEQTAVIPDSMRDAAEKAFFGGRFEISRAGPVNGVYSYDIASAYPFAMTQLPCLRHGRWEWVKNPKIREIEDAPAACIRYKLPMHDKLKIIELPESSMVKAYVDIEGKACENEAWGPFPYRVSDGNILFPVVSEGGWVWKDEFLVGLQNFPNVVLREAWILRQSCDCGLPFAQKMAGYYNQRLEWGKEGKGIALKLGVNACYGKRAQRVGSAPFHCVVSAGMITAKCRAMLLLGIALSEDRWKIISVATDGIQATCKLNLPIPPFTGTEEVAKAKGKYPLGAWECKEDGKPQNQHIIRPGMRFVPESEKQSDTAARGLGVRTLHNSKNLILDAWKRSPMGDVYIQQPTMFMGCKVSVRANQRARDALTLVRMGKATISDIADEVYGGFERDKNYGNWIKPEPRAVSYTSLPKRPMHDGSYRLLPCALNSASGESVAYGKAATSALAREAEQLKTLVSEQPDQDAFPTLGEAVGEAGQEVGEVE